MNKQEFALISASKNLWLKGANLSNQTPRTLLYGYTFNRDTFHTYLDEFGKIHVVVYSYGNSLIEHLTEPEEGFDPLKVIPPKRAYPGQCDFEVCSLISQADYTIPFTTFSEENVAESGFHGLKFEDLTIS